MGKSSRGGFEPPALDVRWVAVASLGVVPFAVASGGWGLPPSLILVALLPILLACYSAALARVSTRADRQRVAVLVHEQDMQRDRLLAGVRTLVGRAAEPSMGLGVAYLDAVGAALDAASVAPDRSVPAAAADDPAPTSAEPSGG